MLSTNCNNSGLDVGSYAHNVQNEHNDNTAGIANYAPKGKIVVMPSRVALEELEASLARLPDTSIAVLEVSPPAFALNGPYNEYVYILFLRAADAIHERILEDVKWKQ